MVSEAKMRTAAEIEAIRERANAATPGPWSRRAEDGRILAPDPEWLDVPGSMIGVVTASRYPGQEGMVFASDKDAAFILDARSDVPALLSHLDALAAPADGEALGRELWSEVSGNAPDLWDSPDASPTAKDRWRATALALHAIGYAAGALAREGEIAALRESCDDLRAQLEGVRHGARKIVDERDAEIARLTAELVEARASAARWEAAYDKADLANAVADREEQGRIDTARLDGARVEREAFGDAAQRLTNGPAPSDTKRAIRAWVEDLCVLREKIADKGGEGGAG